MTETVPTTLSAYPVVTPVTLRFSDQDPMRHVNNVAITALLESGRVGLIDHMMEGVSGDRATMVLASLSIDYRREITFPDTVQVGARLIRVGNRSFTAIISVFQRDVCCVTSTSTNVFFDRETRKSTDPSPQLRAHLLEILKAHDAV